MKLIYKITLTIILSILLIFLSCQFIKYINLASTTGEEYFNTVTFLQGEVDTLQVYMEELERYKPMGTNEYVQFLTLLNGQVTEIVMEFHNIPQRLPMRSNCYEMMFMAINSDMSALISMAEGSKTWIDEEYVKKRLIDTCRKLQWSFEIISRTAAKYPGKYGYFKELYHLKSATHKVIDTELENFLKEVHHIDISN